MALVRVPPADAAEELHTAALLDDVGRLMRGGVQIYDASLSEDCSTAWIRFRSAPRIAVLRLRTDKIAEPVTPADISRTPASSSTPASNSTPAIAATMFTSSSTRSTPATEAGQHAEQAPRKHDLENLERQEGARCRGTVKWFSDAKGYGFIRGDDGRDVFVHYSAVSNAGFRTLTQGQAVEYEVQQSPKGLHAVSVTHRDSVALRFVLDSHRG